MTPQTYRKLIAASFSKDFRAVSEIVTEPMPEPGPDQILVRNIYAGVNATDVNISAGAYTPGATPPIDLGAEAVGEVVAIGADVEHLSVGNFVVTGDLGGGYREYGLHKARFAYPVDEPLPEYLSLLASATTASIGLSVTGDMASDETVLVTAAAGGTGQFAVQLAKLAGNHVIGTCGNAEKVVLLNDLGCDRVINYREEQVGAVLKAEYPDGINLIYESVGGKMFDTCVKALARYGRLVVIGYISEYQNDVPEGVNAPRIYWRLLGKSASIRSMFLPHFYRQVPEHMFKMMGLYHDGKLQARIDPTEFKGVESVPDAVDYLHSGVSSGKVVVKVGDF
jgi:hypothetical protein